MKQKRITAFLLAAELLLMSMTACGKESPEETTAPATDSAETAAPLAEETEAEMDAAKADPYADRINVDDGLPEMTFDGHDFRFLVDEKYAYQLYSEDDSGVGVNAEIYSRNKRVEERFDIKISYMDSLGKESQDLLVTYAQVGEHIAEVCAYEQYMGNTPAIYFCWENWVNIPYLNFDQPWWNKESIDNLTINGYVFNIAGDLSLSAIQMTWCLAVNSNLMEDWGHPMETLYNLVWNGEWTIDKLIEITASLWDDKNGNGNADEGDWFGFGSPVGIRHPEDRGRFNENVIPWITAIDEHPITVGEDKRSLTETLGTEKVYSALEKLVNFHNNNNGVNMDAEVDLFSKGEIGIYTARFDVFVTDLHDSDFTAGILPLPKYDTAQENYITSPDSYFTMFGVPVTLPQEDYDLEGVIMEALNAESWKTVYPAYYEYALRGRYSADENMARMIELIADSRIYEYAPLCGQSLNNAKLHTLMCVCIDENNTDLASILAENDHFTKRALAEILVFFDVEDETGILGADYEIPDAKFGE